MARTVTRGPSDARPTRRFARYRPRVHKTIRAELTVLRGMARVCSDRRCRRTTGAKAIVQRSPEVVLPADEARRVARPEGVTLRAMIRDIGVDREPMPRTPAQAPWRPVTVFVDGLIPARKSDP